MKRKSIRRRRVGFTLMEVLLVLAILVILGSMVGVYFIGTQKSAYEKNAFIQMGHFKSQLQLYRMDVGSYPQSLQALRTPPPDLRNPAKWRGPYAESDIPLDPWDNEYKYELVPPDMIRISSAGADGIPGNDDDVVTQN